MNSFTNSFTYLKHRERYLRAKRLRELAKKIASYNVSFYIPRQDAEEPFSPFARRTNDIQGIPP